MSLLQKYQAFLANPKSSQLDNEATLCYVPTNVVVSGSVGVVKHIGAMNSRAVRDDSKVLHAFEGSDSLSLETASKIEILYGGGAYTPDLNANFVSGQTVTLPFVHVVQFNDGLIKAIRLYWDQGSLLKDLDIISARGTSWPIRSGTTQIDTLLELSGTAPSEETEQPKKKAPTSPTKRVTRDLNNLLLGDYSDDEKPPSKYPVLSPIKKNAGKSIVPNRLFDEDVSEKPIPKTKTVPQPKWSFEDFSTPLQNKPRMRQGQKPTFAWDDGDDVEPSPEHVRRARVGTESQFEITDEIDTQDTPHKAQDKRSLYHDPWGDDTADQDGSGRPTGPAKRTGAGPRKELERHFDFSDRSPQKENESHENGDSTAATSDAARQKSSKFNKAFQSSWDFGDSEAPAHAPSVKVSGDGTGGLKGRTPDWLFGSQNDAEKEEEEAKLKPKGKPKYRDVNAASSFWDDFI